MWEVIPFPWNHLQNKQDQSAQSLPKWQLAGHFEAVLQAGEEAWEEIIRDTRSWFVRRYPHLFMSESELIAYFEAIRSANDPTTLLQKVEEEKQAA